MSTTSATFIFKVGTPPVLTNTDAPPTIAVVRTDTGATVTTGTMTLASTGLYTFTFTDPAYNLVYLITISYTYLGNTLTKTDVVYGNITPATGNIGTYSISTARRIVRFSARNAGDTTYYPTFLVDLAIKRAANELIRDAHLLSRIDTQDTVANTQAYTVTPGTFRCDRLDSAFLTGPNVVVNGGCGSPYGDFVDEATFIRGGVNGIGYDFRTAILSVVDWPQMNDYLHNASMSGQPTMIAFNNDQTCNLYPVPDQVYTLNLRWSDFFTTWHDGAPLATVNVGTTGIISSVSVIDGSDNLGTASTATLTSVGSGSGATVTPVLANGVLDHVTVGGSGGTGYSGTTAILFGGFSSTDSLLNLPDDYIYAVLTLGAPSYLCMADPEKKFAVTMGEEFKAFVRKIKGNIGGLGVQRIIRRRRY